MNSNIVQVTNRLCEVCHSNEQELLYSQNFIAKTKNSEWVFNVNIVICCNCGFVFTSPCAIEKDLLTYYKDSFSRFNETNDYDIDKRINFIDKYINHLQNRIFLEIGSNRKSEFFYHKLHQRFEKVITMEVTNEVEASYNSFNQIHQNSVGFIAHYFVLEHIRDITSFIKQCHRILVDGGIMIVEVPDISLYNQYFEPLLLHEHVNHFSTNKLIEIASKIGFKNIDVSQKFCSRPYGFVASFLKINSLSSQELIIKNEYQNNKLYIKSGVNLINKFNKTLEQIFNFFLDSNNRNELIIVWGATMEMRIIEQRFFLPQNVTVVDSNPEKINYLSSIKVMTPRDAVEKIYRAKKLILMLGEWYHDEVLNFLKKDLNIVFDSANILKIGDFK